MNLPTVAEIEQLHKKYAPNEQIMQEVWPHCQIVHRLALWCVENRNLKVDMELLQVGALLHDIGAYTFYEPDGRLIMTNYIQHGILGYDILKKEGFDEAICRFASCHTGVGLSAEQIERDRLPLPVADYFAETLEEKLVMYADKFHSKDPLQFNAVDWYKQHTAAKFGAENLARFEAMVAEFGVPPVADLAKEYEQPLRAIVT